MKSIVNFAAWTTAAGLETEAAGSTVIRLEHKLAACQTVLSREEKESFECQLANPRTEWPNWIISSARTDGINKTMVHAEALQVTVVASRHNVAVGMLRDARGTSMPEIFQRMLGNTGVQQRGRAWTCVQATEIVGCVNLGGSSGAFPNVVVVAPDTGKFVSMREGHTWPQYFRWFSICIDAGPDVAKLRNFSEFSSCYVPWVCTLTCSCWMHQVHIIYQKLLLISHSWLITLNVLVLNPRSNPTCAYTLIKRPHRNI